MKGNETAPSVAEGKTETGWLEPVAAIWAAYAITCFVAIATIYSMGWHVTSTTGDPMAIAAVTVCGLLPQGLLAPLGGVVADRFNRKGILLICYVVIAVAAIATAGLILAGHLSLPVILAFVLAMGVRNGFRDPAFSFSSQSTACSCWPSARWPCSRRTCAAWTAKPRRRLTANGSSRPACAAAIPRWARPADPSRIRRGSPRRSLSGGRNINRCVSGAICPPFLACGAISVHTLP